MTDRQQEPMTPHASPLHDPTVHQPVEHDSSAIPDPAVEDADQGTPARRDRNPEPPAR